MIQFSYRGRQFEDHGSECGCLSCANTNWGKGLRCVVMMSNTAFGHYQIYGGPVYFTKEDAADQIIKRVVK